MTTLIETERLILRRPEAGDLEAWMPFVMSERADFVRSGEAEEATGWRAFAGIIGHWELRGFGTMVFALKGAANRALGMTGPWFPHGWPEKEIGWTLWDGADEGKGYVREAAEAARAYADKQAAKAAA